MTDGAHLKAKALVKKYLNDDCTEAEKAWVEQWYLSLNDAPHELSDREIESDLQELEHRLSNISKKRSILRLYVQTAAAVGLICLALPFLWKQYRPVGPSQAAASVQLDVMPGTNKAFLSLDGGEQIALKETQEGLVNNGRSISYKDGTALKQIENVQMATLTTPIAGQYQVTLPDGTQAWLNAESSIRYPTRFTDDKRVIFVTGEVYLEVAKNRTKPFIVNTPQQQVRVLGTSFNINAYPDAGKTVTTLAEGSLQVSSIGTKNQVLLAPDQQAVVANGKIDIQDVDAEDASSWKSGLCIINNEPLANYARQIERWYNVEVQMERAGGVNLSAIIPRSARLSEVLQAIELKTGVKFKIEGRRVTAIK